MKSIQMIILLIATAPVFAGGNEKTEKIKVYGVCDMCKERIEKAAIKSGASKADWSEETQQLTFSYDASKTSLEKIEKGVVKAGHDTETLKANNKSYNKLPHCCHYQRPEEKK
jgi:mercuric ion binding protein